MNIQFQNSASGLRLFLYSFSLEFVAMVSNKCRFPSCQIEAFLDKLWFDLMCSFRGRAGKLVSGGKNLLSLSYLFMLFVASHIHFSQYVVQSAHVVKRQRRKFVDQASRYLAIISLRFGIIYKESEGTSCYSTSAD